MERKKASDFPQELLNLFDGYVHGGISRRDFWMVHRNSPSPV
jgi:carboxymethylenebutenolidase